MSLLIIIGIVFGTIIVLPLVMALSLFVCVCGMILAQWIVDKVT